MIEEAGREAKHEDQNFIGNYFDVEPLRSFGLRDG